MTDYRQTGDGQRTKILVLDRKVVRLLEELKAILVRIRDAAKKE